MCIYIYSAVLLERLQDSLPLENTRKTQIPDTCKKVRKVVASRYASATAVFTFVLPLNTVPFISCWISLEYTSGERCTL